VATKSWVNREYRRGRSTCPCRAPVRKSRTQLHKMGFRPRAPNLRMSLEGTVVLKVEL
jgi:hypothetical protein